MVSPASAGRLRPHFVRASALRREAAPLTTGYADLDGLIGEMEGGLFYLFCGEDDMRFVDGLVHRIIVRACRIGRVAYMNSTDYYRGKTLISADRLAQCAKAEGIEPALVLERTYTAAAYSDLRQPRAAAALEERMRRDGSTVLLVAHAMPVFYEAEGGRGAAREALNRSISALWRASAEMGAVMVATAAVSGAQRPSTSSLMADLASVIVAFRAGGNGRFPDGACATLLKHPARGTPAAAHIFGGGEFRVGRITPPFRQNYQQLLERLRGGYAGMLRDPADREGFDLLLKEAWDREHAAMSNSEIPLVLDALNLTANVHNKGEIQRLKEGLAERDRRIEDLERRLKRVELGLGAAEAERGDGKGGAH